ncbi:MAG: hypothetical protein ABSH20_21765, partial [Tepidisphaeraceae bacterium]
GPGRFEHRTSRDKHRTNMLAGLCLQPGAWDKTEGPMDDLAISNVTMRNVTTPLHLSLKPGNVGGRVTIDRMTATGCYLAAASIESWAETPIEHVTLRDVNLSFTGGGTAEQAKLLVKSPPVDARPLPAWGLYVRNVKHLDLVNVRLSLDADDVRPMVICDGVERLTLDALEFPRSAEPPFVFTGVGDVRLSETNLPVARARCLDLKIEPLAVAASIENGPQDGLTKVELSYAGKTLTRWVYLKASEKTDVVFTGLPALPPGKHELRCGDVIKDITRP